MFRRIHLIPFSFTLYFIFQVTHIKAPKTAEDEFIEIQSATGTAIQRWAVRCLTLCKLVGSNTRREQIGASNMVAQWFSLFVLKHWGGWMWVCFCTLTIS